MKLFKKVEKAMEKKDLEAFTKLLHKDYQFVRHQTGTVLDRDGMVEMTRYLFASPDTRVQQRRLIYENDDLVVEHSVMDFPDGSREAVLGVHTKKGNKIVRTETGATVLKPAEGAAKPAEAPKKAMIKA